MSLLANDERKTRARLVREKTAEIPAVSGRGTPKRWQRCGVSLLSAGNPAVDIGRNPVPGAVDQESFNSAPKGGRIRYLPLTRRLAAAR